MKKTYMQPLTMVAVIAKTSVVCASGVTSEKGIDYGGVDDEGGMEPASRRRRNVWDDEEDEEYF